MKKIATVCLLFAFSSKLLALPPADLPADVELFIAGASSLDKTLINAISALCQDAPDQYSEAGSIPGSAYTAIFCTMSDAQLPGLQPTNTSLKVLIHKRSKSGSQTGAAPVEAQDSITRMSVDASCTLTATAHQYQCTGTTNDVPKVGITDVEPSLYRGVNVSVPNIVCVDSCWPEPMTQVQIDRLDKKSVAALTVGIVVTKNLRDALQTVQGLTSSSDEESQMPSLTKSQVASLFAGTITNWNEFQNAAGTAITSVSGVVAPVNTRVEVCRRTQGAGIQAVINQYFLNQPCDVAIAPKSDNTGASGTAGTGSYTSLIGVSGAAVHWNESSGNVNSCMSALNGANYWAIGLQSLEQTNAAWRFVKINGVAPLLKNVAQTKYDLIDVPTIQWIKAGQPGALTGNQLLLASHLRSALGSEVYLRAANLGFLGSNITVGGVLASGEVGWAALTAAGASLNIPFDVTRPVIPLSNLGVSNANANSCAAKLLIGGKSQM